jgi:hypothetical protein
MEDEAVLKAELSLFCQNLKFLNSELRTPFEHFCFLLVIQFIREQKRRNKSAKHEDHALDACKSYFRTFFNKTQFDKQCWIDEQPARIEMQIPYYALRNLKDYVCFLQLKVIEQKVVNKQVVFLVNRTEEQRGLAVPQYLKQLN